MASIMDCLSLRPSAAAGRTTTPAAHSTSTAGSSVTRWRKETRTLVNEGHITGTSVAFHRARRETKDGILWVVSAELLNCTITPIPSNPGARILSSKTRGRGDDEPQRRARRIQEEVDANDDLRMRKELIQTQLRLLSADLDRIERREQARRFEPLKRVLAAMGDRRTIAFLEDLERRSR
jgi:hypothetical protein